MTDKWVKRAREMLDAFKDVDPRLQQIPAPIFDLSNITIVDSGALTMALNVLRRANKNEVADALEATAKRLTK